MQERRDCVTRDEWEAARLRDIENVKQLGYLIDGLMDIVERYREQLKGIEQDMEIRHPLPAD